MKSFELSLQFVGDRPFLISILMFFNPRKYFTGARLLNFSKNIFISSFDNNSQQMMKG